MASEDLGKKIMGSVAVDSETGMEHYNVPKKKVVAATTPISEESEQNKAPEGMVSPNYGKANDNDSSQNLAGVPEEFLRLFEHDPSEVIMYQARRHPVGVIGIYGAMGLTAFILITGFLFLSSNSDFLGSAGLSSSAIGIGWLVIIFLLVLMFGIGFVAAYVYKKSRMILTNQKVVLILYHSLFSREISQLNISEVEDVNVSQPSILDRIFRTGRVTIETAGEQNNYVLNQVENPHEFAHKTIQAHEGAIAQYGN